MVIRPRNFETLDPDVVEVLLAYGVRPCICEGRGQKMDTIAEAAAYDPPWVRPYCLAHGDQAPAVNDLARFPRALDSYSCDECRNGVHVRCRGEVRLPDWSCPCTCAQASPDAHAEARHEAKRTALAAVIEEALADSAWVDALIGSAHDAALDVADALIDKRLA